jgi:serine/threonine-protein kinase
LAKALEHHRRLPLPSVLWIARQVAEALDALHTSVRMIHADVKPANILVAPDGHATLIDLGFVHSPAESRHWSTRPVYGTLQYIAPEALTSSLAASPQSDLYSLGVTLYEMLAGGPPFVGRDAEQLVRLHREATPECLRMRRPDIPTLEGSPAPSRKRRRRRGGTRAPGNRLLRGAVKPRLVSSDRGDRLRGRSPAD